MWYFDPTTKSRIIVRSHSQSAEIRTKSSKLERQQLQQGNETTRTLSTSTTKSASATGAAVAAPASVLLHSIIMMMLITMLQQQCNNRKQHFVVHGLTTIHQLYHPRHSTYQQQQHQQRLALFQTSRDFRTTAATVRIKRNPHDDRDCIQPTQRLHRLPSLLKVQYRSKWLSPQTASRRFAQSSNYDGNNSSDVEDSKEGRVNSTRTATVIDELNDSSTTATNTGSINDEITKTPAELEAVQAAREARKAEKERLKAEKLAKQQQQQLVGLTDGDSVIDDVIYMSVDEEDTYQPMGDMARIMSRSDNTGRNFIQIATLESPSTTVTEKDYGTKSVWICGRINSIRIKGGSCFLVIRQDSFHTIQCVYFKEKENPERSKKMMQYLKSLTVESVIQLQGTILGPVDVKSCSVSNIEIGIQRIYAISKADAILPFLVEDASRSEQEVEESQSTDRPYPRLGQELRLDHRWMDLRTPANNAIMRIQSAVCQLFRESLYDQGFIEIHTPKLIAGESESGAGVFTTDYFGTTACLAQSPQLYKQMAIVSDLQRVFEIGPVFRAENSNTRRHLCEFTGLDLEMSIIDHYMETLTIVHTMFKHIFNGLETRWAKELAIIREQYASEPVTFTDEPCVIHWPEAMSILKDNGYDMGDELQDLTGAMELTLGKVIKERYGTDFFMLDQYPSQIRPFYTMPSPKDERYSNSYDMFLRGQEICSGAQRCHDPNLVLELIQTKGIVVHDDGLLHKYIESFRHGVQPHAGAGIGLERVVFLYLGLDNVRKASMFPRDPNRCVP